MVTFSDISLLIMTLLNQVVEVVYMNNITPFSILLAYERLKQLLSNIDISLCSNMITVNPQISEDFGNFRFSP